MNGSIRIIGGKWRGRKLSVLDKQGLRPTTDRVKETLFNWLMPVIHDSDCLDCFSGSGSLGFEAASRGAKSVTLLEKDKQVANLLTKNKQLIASHAIDIYHTDTLTWLNKPAQKQFDIIFIDPPFHQSLVEKTVSQLEGNNWLKPSSYIYIETELTHNVTSYIPTNWHLHREKAAGQVQSYLFIRDNI
ncbi:16S rRNA (guanine(966)-N(2))-methyltransferase RsmD [Gilliamella sp. Choc4-2]|jgi:16S rRNA (guanine966-N2)-methyltransferase|uniref:16S rRNA (guanine(966)-N(2))-methyltransferase RsmD n=1 Tax=unclassified Gilliamella TaxID=2685620 RepID=UPI0004DCDDA6|nr:16S rRNA (guanine(966)-N(2))-methyltransferase RsmD [Gilliamella apicola]KFA59449.1 16S rRNA (guanine(966)-N(2))-methyltransferase SSU rRNA m(2)G966 [Gilliamella apicola]OCG32062.1 16S rRNA (guanine(966)-N(2))-methyltransferase RsmD [Gilliamella apicola]OCG45134.1 16S rRNA (guanine(966)-N(2))-methyltransferase RsmD [Gilliamella apicola]OCG54706.1 16S rRNA (guanine(966)-N(2))-methyltransferase RsmD [Gilliamella apicola]OCG62966.1 16S rRNA (guanine(966)-N(2))-methyltransferase RsmD [Gilliamel